MKKMKAGRKPVNDKKELVGIYRTASEIKKLGGKENLRNKLNNHTNNLLNETIN
jgi:hypothetical protein